MISIMSAVIADTGADESFATSLRTISLHPDGAIHPSCQQVLGMQAWPSLSHASVSSTFTHVCGFAVQQDLRHWQRFKYTLM